MTIVRTRYAPSPTGLLHVGGVRTVLYSWLLARKHGGQFLLRIEDTDQERLVPGAIRALLEDFKWLGIDIDEGPSRADLAAVGEAWEGSPDIGGPCGPYIQSLRLKRYKEIAEQLVAKGFAYRCDCTSEMLEKERLEQMARRESPGYSGYCRHRNVSADTKHVIRFMIPADRKLQLHDAVKGPITWDGISLRDTVLLKSDGFPTYHLAVVVDDHDMKISHVLRGDEWLATAPIHLLIYEALGWEKPVFSHLPPVLGTDGKKLSKRHGSTSVNLFREAGYLPEALLNFLLLIGWSPGKGSEQEIFTRAEMIEQFSLEKVNAAGGVFAYDKLDWMNGNYIRALTPEQLKDQIRPFLTKAGLEINEGRLSAIVPHIQERMKKLSEAPEQLDFLFKPVSTRDFASVLKKGLDKPAALQMLQLSAAALDALADFSASSIEAALRPLADQIGQKLGVALGPLRVAISGRNVTPPLFESLHALGKGESVGRIRATISELERYTG